MAKIHAAAALAAGFTSRYPNAGLDIPTGGSVPSLLASADESLPSVQAASVRGYAAVSGDLTWVKAKEHFFHKFQFIGKDDLVQLPDEDAKKLIAAGKADEASDEEVAEAQAASAAKAKK